MKTSLLYVSLFTTAVFQSCVKDGGAPECNLYLAISTNGPVAAGGTLELHVDNVPLDAVSFNWTGPAGFTSEEEHPVINNIRTVQAGKYTVEVRTSNACMASVTSDSVIITSPSAPCSRTANTGTLTGAGTLNFTTVIVGPGASSYSMTATATSGTCVLEFAGTAKPTPGLYKIQPTAGNFVLGDVRVRITALGSTWTASTGNVYVTNAGGKVAATACSITFSSPSFPGFPATASANITEQ